MSATLDIWSTPVMNPYMQQVMKNAVTCSTMTLGIGKYVGLNIFIAGNSKAPQGIGDVKVKGGIQLEEGTLGMTDNCYCQGIGNTWMDSVVRVKMMVVASDTGITPRRVEDISVERHDRK